MRILSLVTDGFGGHGGIALHCRSLLTALCQSEEVSAVAAIPRVKPVDRLEADGPLPQKLTYHDNLFDAFLGYPRTLLKVGLLGRPWDVVITEHINLLPAAALLARCSSAKLILITHGFEAWERPGKLRETDLQRVDHVVSVSSVTQRRFSQWSGFDNTRSSVIVNAMDFSDFSPAPKPRYLKQRYAINDEKIIMTLGRLDAGEKAKGFDQIINSLPSLIKTEPNIRYMIVGDGDDAARLDQLAKKQQVREQVIFTGRISQEEKIDHYRLADAYVMPSRLEGFGYVFLEAMACGLPVVGSILDGSQDALLGGSLGDLVDPDNPAELQQAILRALSKPKMVPDELEVFSLPRFNQAFQDLVVSLAK